MHRSSRRLMCSLSIIILAALLAACGSAPPRILVEPSSQDLGERPQQPVELSYTVRNTGGGTLLIQKITTSCDCTKASVDRTEIPAGQTASLKVTLDPAEDNLYGNILRVVYLRTNDPQRPEVEAEFRVTIQKPGS